ncbi:MAG: chemotaxis response regulator protein-glutamate methylesterase [Gemmatimonadales bacterium]
MAKIRVLVVDDSVVVRRLVTDLLSADPDVEVVGVAANGKLALAKLDQLTPDLVTLDIEMPEMDGLETLVHLRKRYPTLPVIMFSTLTERGAGATMEALACGASDYVTKPANVGSVTQAQAQLREELIPKIKALCGRVVVTRLAVPTAPARVPPTASPSRADILAIGVSTGGPNALAALLPALPADFPLPIVIVQHMPPVFTRFLAERLRGLCHLDVQEAEDGGVVRPGLVWIAPGNFHMKLRRDGTDVRVVLDQEAPENSCRPSVDPLFRSVAQLYGAHTLSVVLTGMGQDGLHGAEAIRQVHGQVLVQDEATSVVWGMPRAVALAGLADGVLPLGLIASELLRRAQVGRPLRFAQPLGR